MTQRDFAVLCERIDRLLSEKETVAVAIDGDSCAGKTTLAARLSERYGVDAIHMDDFYLPLSLRTPERYAEPGGNVHRERFLREVAPHLHDAAAFSYGILSTADFQIHESRKIGASRLRIVEGSYSQHPELRAFYDLTVFLKATASEQRERVLQRNGEEKLPMFLGRWIPLEKAYHAAYRVEENADLIF